MRDHTTIRFAKRDEELKQFLVSKGGLTPGLRWLYEYYKQQKDINILDEIKTALASIGTNTVITKKATLKEETPKVEVKASANFNHSDDFTKMFG